MKVKLIAKTEPIDKHFKDAQEFTAFVARVSNPSNQYNNATSEKLIRYCLKKEHWSVFEHYYLTFEIETTRDIARQILRHRSFTFQEFSQRYANPTDLGFETREARLQDTTNRQNSIETNDEELQKAWEAKQQQISHEAGLAYKWAIENGIAKEQARAVLPEGLTVSKLYVTGNLRSFFTYTNLRRKHGTQKEHQEIAQEIYEILVSQIIPAFKDEGKDPYEVNTSKIIPAFPIAPNAEILEIKNEKIL